MISTVTTKPNTAKPIQNAMISLLEGRGKETFGRRERGW
jgi:hypothetical protein